MASPAQDELRYVGLLTQHIGKWPHAQLHNDAKYPLSPQGHHLTLKSTKYVKNV